ncbi:MAG TPA: hypothetical protein VK797_23115 [Tepidisphaeraceae bacterium]|jgi:hypothetical protein|nr:hypothetical protein [Tepidisphaeraceae bacterium]
MSENKHTPGPWIWQSFDGGETFFLGTPDRGRLMVMDFVRQGFNRATARFAIREGDKGGLMKAATLETVESFPDARLIAAAPELLEACKLMHWAGIGIAQHQPTDPVAAAIWEQLTNAINAARSAITKAEGKTP